MIDKHRNELEKLPDEIKYEINKCLEIYENLKNYDKGELDIHGLQEKLQNILDKYEL